ncbi:DNA replication helicase/nuclease 2 [Xylocopa sonorina]|uniref:DNA replication helicase/nuclease 2 n=1 Tax=Xylocopa sonorina TaxID=1818115 RepID=UPI00403AE06F
MKKVDCNKHNLSDNEKQVQTKLSQYFTKTNKSPEAKDTAMNETSVKIKEGCKKRKASDDLELLQTKSTKYDDSHKLYDSPNKQKQNRTQMDDPNLSVLNTIPTVWDDVQWDDIPIAEYKENIDLKNNKNIPCQTKETMQKENRNLSTYHPLKEHGTDSTNKSRHSNTEKECQLIDINDFNDFSFGDEWSLDSQINFNTLQRCEIVEVKIEDSNMILTVTQKHLDAESNIVCSGFWRNCIVRNGDIVAVQAVKISGKWVIDNNNGYLVNNPDLLMSGTTVATATFCSRKSVLMEKFRKIESLPYQTGDASPMVIGTLVHQLMQRAIVKGIQQLTDIKNLMDDILLSKETSSLLYASEITLDACKQQMLPFIPKIYEFIQHYLRGEKQRSIVNVRNNFEGQISQICDIEENVWLPALGMKGKIDITAEVKTHSKKKIMPLEIKTGKPSFSLEHRGQVILYIMMMALTGQDTDSGLLLYLRDNHMSEIKGSHSERRDLILLRNTLVNYLTPTSPENLTTTTSKSDWQTMQLPEPINHHSACSKCTYNTLCCMYLQNNETQLSDSHPLTKLGKEILGKFKHTHIDYVLLWISLLEIEESAQSSESIMRYLWTLTAEKREMKKICISNLKVIGKVSEHNSKYKHTFVRANLNVQFSHSKIPYMEFADNEYVLISTNVRVNISAGFIVKRTEDSIIVLLDRDITKYNSDESFHIDKYTSSNLVSFNLANVGGLLADNEICERLRDIIIDRKPATFDKGIPHSLVQIGTEILKKLNEDQQRAVLKAMSANDYMLIKGMPGTGKTQTLVALIQLLHETRHTVLITAHTNSAVDNILLKLLDKGIDFLRLGSSVHSSLKYKSEGHVTSHCCTPDDLEAVYLSKNIVGVTCYGAHHALLVRRTFDYCVVDESTQVMQPTVLRALYSAHKFILVGDPDQLPPIIKSKVARKLGATESLFARLDNQNNTVYLTKQYRMNKRIMHLANELTYNNLLEAGNEGIKNATFVSVDQILEKEGKWVRDTLSSDMSKSVVILNTGCTSNLNASYDVCSKYSESDQMHSNIWEGAIVSKLVKTLLKMSVKQESIGVIAAYRSHVNLLKTIVTNDIEVNTVDQYQGRDKEVIIYSCAKSLTSSDKIKEDLEVLGDHRRLTVAVTRAKHKLIIIADKSTVSQYTVFKKLFDLVEDENTINLRDNYDDFSWRNLVSDL